MKMFGGENNRILGFIHLHNLMPISENRSLF